MVLVLSVFCPGCVCVCTSLSVFGICFVLICLFLYWFCTVFLCLLYWVCLCFVLGLSVFCTGFILVLYWFCTSFVLVLFFFFFFFKMIFVMPKNS